MFMTADLVVAIATLAIAIATIFTVCEMGRQRKAAVRPDLASRRQHAFVYSDGLQPCFRHVWRRERIQSARDLEQLGYSISLVNLGAGAAKRIRSHWSIDIDSMVENVNCLAREATVAVSAELGPRDSEIRILWPDKVVGHHLVENQLSEDWDYLLPATLDAQGLQVSVPSAYLTLASLQVALGWVADKDIRSAEKWLRLPAARLDVRYADVYGETHRRKFHLVLTPLGAGHDGAAYSAGQIPTFIQFMVSLDEVKP